MPVFHAFRGRAPLLALAVAMLSSACGGEGTGSPPVSSPTPPQPAGPGTPGIGETGGIPSGFRLAWADEFDVAGLPDPTKWSYDVDRNSAGWYNNELQYYGSARLENSRVENGMLVITARREGSVTVIDVRDTGPGVPELARAHLFEAFQSVARKGGTGLGLAIAAELVNAHGGEIALIDNAGGATFRVVIPDVVIDLQRARRRSA